MRLFWLLSWPYLRRHVLRWALTLSGIVLGVAVFVAMNTANRSIFHAFDRTVDQIAGATELQVTAGEFGFPEETLERVQAVREVGVAVPVIESIVETADAREGSLMLLGIDMTGDRSLRSYALKDAETSGIDDPLVFLAQPDSLMVTTDFAERHGLSAGRTVVLRTIQGDRPFTVRGVMSSGGLSQAFGGNLVVMDIYAAERVLGRDHRFDRLDLRARKGVTVEECQAAVQRVLGPGFEVEPPSSRGKHFEALLRSYSTWMSIASLFALIVGTYIIYNSFAIAVTQRRTEIGILRALGATSQQIQRLFLLESIVAGAAGSVVGIFAGLAGATAIVRYTSSVVEMAGGVAQRVTELSVGPGLVAAGLGVGVGTSLFAAWLPARSAATIDPVLALQKGKYQVPTASENRQRRLLALVLIGFSLASPLFATSNVVFYGGFASVIVAGLLLAPALTQWLAKALRPALRQALPVEGALAADSLVQAPRRTAATVGALMLSLSMVVAFGGFVDAFYASVGEWLDNVMNNDFLVTASTNLTARRMTFPADLAPVIAAVDGVEQVQVIRNARVIFHDSPVMVMAMETRKVESSTKRSLIAGNLQDMYRLTAEGRGTFVSGSFATNNRLKLNDVVELPTPTGTLRLPIVGIVRDYSDLQGTMFIDRSVYVRWWKDTTVNTARVYIKKDQNSTEVRKRVLAALAGRGRLLVLTNREVRGWILDLLNQWFVLTYNQIVVAILVAVLGIVNTLTVSIADRRRELGVMRAVGGLRRQIRHTMWLEAVTIAIIGLILGIAMGSINLYYSLGMVRRDLGGFDLDYVFPVAFVLLTIPTILAAAFVAALGPGESAVRSTLVEALEYE